MGATRLRVVDETGEPPLRKRISEDYVSRNCDGLYALCILHVFVLG